MMICTWMDDRPVTVSCSLCGADVHTTARQRGRIYCLPCRDRRRKETAAASADRARLKKNREKLAAAALPVVGGFGPPSQHRNDSTALGGTPQQAALPRCEG